MRNANLFLVLAAGVGIGVTVATLCVSQPQPARAASNDRYEDYVMATGAVSINARIQTDGVWLLDYKSGKLLGTVIDRQQGKIIGWAEVDLVTEFEVQPRQDVHFMMTTGYITQGQSALYVAETTTAKFGVYTMGPGPNGQGIGIRRHDMSSFRAQPPAGVAPGGFAPPVPGAVGLPGAPVVPALPGGQPVPPVIPKANPRLPGEVPPVGLPALPVIPVKR